ncbi:MAG TPA: PAS domain S-box protein [Candidatus Bathyarchaeia archaeon]|nr:PAS domain S-box protein [Candidatus Bathyarchaeia archaeon]
MPDTGRRTEKSATAEQAFKAFFERSPIAKIRYDAHGYPTDINSAAATLLGVADATAIAHISLFSTPRISDADKNKLSQGKATRYEQRYDFDEIKRRGDFLTTRSGVSFLDVHVIPISAQAGVIKEYIGEFVDITDRKDAEGEIASIAKFPEENPNPVLRLAPDGAVLFANEASKTLLQDERGSFDQLRGAIARTHRAGKVATLDLTVGTRDFLFTLVPLAEGYVNVYGTDISERTRAEDALREAHEEVQALNEELHSTNEELRVANQELEYRVQERTEELASMNEELRATNEELISTNDQLQHETAFRTEAEVVMRHHAERLEILNRIITLADKATDVRSYVKAILDIFVDQLGFDGAVLRFLNGDVVELYEARGLAPQKVAELQREAVTTPPLDHIYVGQPYFADDERNLPSSLSSATLAVGIPLIASGKVIGNFNLGGRNARSLSDTQKDALVAIGHEAGTVIARLQAENEALRRATMLDNANDAIVTWDDDDLITYWNDGAERLYGWARDEALGRNVHTLLQTTFPHSLKRIKSMLNKTGIWQGELTHVTRAGTTVVVESHMSRQQAGDRSGTTLEINADITSRKLAERQARAASLYARSLIEASVDPLVTISAEGKINDVNKATEDVTGYSREELIGSDFSSYFTEPSKADVGYKQVFAKGVVRDYPLAIRHKSGTITDVLYNATVFADERGNVQGVFAAARDVTDRKRAQRQVQAAARYARELIEASLDPLVTISADGKITDVNKATEEVTGYPRDELIGSDFSEYFTEPDKAREGYQQAFSDGVVRDYALAIRHKSGRVTDVLYNATVYEGEDGIVQGVFAAARDVTAQKHAEAALRESHERVEALNEQLHALNEELQKYSRGLEELVEERTVQLAKSEEEFRTLFDKSSIAQIRYDAKGLPIRMNNAAVTLLGVHDVGEISHRSLFSDRQVPQEDLDRLREGYPLHAEQVCDFPAIREGGLYPTTRSDVIQIDCYVLPLVNPAGTVVEGYLLQFVDITQRKKAEEALKASEQQYRTLVETANSAIFTLDTEGTITYVNEYGAGALGYTPDELIGQNVMVIVPETESSGRDMRPYIDDIVAHPDEHSASVNENITKDGKRLWFNWVNKALIDEEGHHIGHLTMGYDITEQIRAEDALRDAQRLAGIGETAAMIGHDLRNPLQGLQYIIDLQKMRFDRTPPEERDATDWRKAAESFDRIGEQIFYMDKIVGDLQDYARPLQPQVERISLSNLIEDVLEQVPHDSNVWITTSIKGIHIEADRHFMHRAFANLILNAVQALPEGGTVTITGSTTDHEVVVTIHDTGVGIPAEVQEKLFSPLVTGKAKGTGLGLAVVKRIIDAHRGTIEFASEEGNGTTFTVTLPVSSAKIS